MNNKEKIFIAGAAGMVGSAVIRKLLSIGYSNLVGSYHSRVPDAARFFLNNDSGDLPPELRLVKIDLMRQQEVEDFFESERPDYVFAAAARVGGIHANNTYPAQFIYENLTIQNNIIQAAYRSNVKRLLFLGSSCIYPRLAPQPMKEEHLLTGLLEPTNEPYAIAKIAGIKMCEAYNRQYHTRFMAVMPTNLYGPNDNFDLANSHVLPALIRKFHLAKLAASGDWAGIQKDESCYGPIPHDITEHSALNTVLIWGTGSPRREFLHVDDMADACVFVMNLDEQTLSDELLSYPKPCFVNVGAGVDVTIRELAEMIRDVVGFRGEILFDASKPDGTPQKLLGVSRLAGLGWKSRIALRNGIQQTYEWFTRP